MKRAQVNHITGSDAVDWIKSGKHLYFPDGEGMYSCWYDDVTHTFYFTNYQGQSYGTGWNEAYIANKSWEIER